MARPCWRCGATAVTPTPTVFSPPPRDLATLLASNEIPSDSDMPVLRKRITEGQAQVDALNAHITELQTMLGRLIAERDQISDLVHQYESAVSTVRRLPQDLVCEILGLLSRGSRRMGRESIDAPPWVLAQVCRSWRHAALTYGSLWSTIEISPLSTSPDIIEAQLQRSGDALLQIYCYRLNSKYDVHPRVLELIVSQSHRWRTLHLKQIGLNADLSWLWPTNNRLAALESLWVYSPAQTVVPDVFSTAGQLRRVVLSGEGSRMESPFVAVPWSQVTHYRGRYPAERQRDILSLAANLVECAIGDTTTASGEPITLPHLRRLIITENHFLDNLTTPNLTELHVSDTDFDPYIFPFIARSSLSSTLTKLILSCVTLPPALVATLAALPTLTYLLIETSLGGPKTQTALFEALALPESENPLEAGTLPNLETLIYGYPPGSAFPASPFFNMLRSRSGRLRHVRVFGELPSIGLASGLSALREAGVDASFVRNTTWSAVFGEGKVGERVFNLV
ncbi:hypothetical protein FB45DRAFT_901820 [Roridomyces roridus]|uniref:F-box domain-containing protein n=1 Tax=Roridomyces roridus TaxID=1738132 RepID=A0AAD7C916_9AGAR|nr:hypothetical protein FB45DRAFT_901820 [Roridomyces roridus]